MSTIVHVTDLKVTARNVLISTSTSFGSRFSSDLIELWQERRDHPCARFALFSASVIPAGDFHAMEKSLKMTVLPQGYVRLDAPIDMDRMAVLLKGEISHRFVHHEYIVMPKVAALHDFLKSGNGKPQLDAVKYDDPVKSYYDSFERCALCWEPCIDGVALAWDAFLPKEIQTVRTCAPMHVFHACCAAYLAASRFPTCPCTVTRKHLGWCFDVAF